MVTRKSGSYSSTRSRCSTFALVGTSEEETKGVTSDHPAGVGGLSVRPVGTCDNPIVPSQTIFLRCEVGGLRFMGKYVQLAITSQNFRKIRVYSSFCPEMTPARDFEDV